MISFAKQSGMQIVSIAYQSPDATRFNVDLSQIVLQNWLSPVLIGAEHQNISARNPGGVGLPRCSLRQEH